MEKHVTVTWSQDLDFVATIEDGVSVPMGSEVSATSVRPAAMLLASLAGCTAMDAISIMRKKRQPVASYTVQAVGRQRDEHPRSYVSIVVTHIVEGPVIDDRAVARAIELSARRYCMVGASLASGDTAIEHRFIIRDGAGERTCECVTIGPNGKGLARLEAILAGPTFVTSWS